MSEFSDKIFGVFGGVVDGAVSVAGDVLDYKLRSQEIAAQSVGASTTTAEPSFNRTAITDTNGFINFSQTNVLIIGAVALSGLATVFALFK